MDTTIEGLFFLTTLTLMSAAAGVAAWAWVGVWAALAAALGWAFGALAFTLFGRSRRLCFPGEPPYDAWAAARAERAELDGASAPGRPSKTIRL